MLGRRVSSLSIPLLLPWVAEKLRPVAPAGHGFRIALSREVLSAGCHVSLNLAICPTSALCEFLKLLFSLCGC